jgi:hypothetical protein
MIISASRRTDIPAFYLPWLLNRFREGEVYVRNPFNAKVAYRLILTPATVEALVLWSKNPAPLLNNPDLPYPWYMQFTLNDYPSAWESHLPAVQDRIATFRALARRYGSDALVWRYDPIILSGQIDAAWHIARFTTLCQSLEGATNQAVISFLDSYGKITSWMQQEHILSPSIPVRVELAQQLSWIAGQHGIHATACCEAELPLPIAHCVDAHRLDRLAGPLTIPADKGQRPGCGCAASYDIGQYHSCLHGCAYCYATRSLKAAQKHYAMHDPLSPLLCGKMDPGTIIVERSMPSLRPLY